MYQLSGTQVLHTLLATVMIFYAFKYYDTIYIELSLSFNNIDKQAANFLVQGLVHWTNLHKLE